MPPGLFQRMGWRLKAAPVAETESARPTEEELKQDQELVQKAISEAVTAALNNDAFTRSVAVHLATQLQPALKAALNISAVEENLSKRLDEIQIATTSHLSDISNDLNLYKTKDKTSTLEGAVAEINAALAGLGKDVSAIHEQIAQQDTKFLSGHTTKLDGIAKDIKTLEEQIASPDTALLASHTTKLDAITAELATVKEHTETAATLKTITSNLASLKTDVESGVAASSLGLSSLTTHLDSIKSSISSHDLELESIKDSIALQDSNLKEVMFILDTQGAILSEIKSRDSGSEILAGMKASNDNHTAALSTIASKDSSADIADLKSQVATLSTTLSEIKGANISPEILAAVKSSNESHIAHATTLAEIKTATSNPAPPVEKVDLSTIETDVKTIISSIESQNATLSEIKTVAGAPITAAEKTDITALEADVKTLIANLDSHTRALSEIKSSSSSTEILTAIGAQDAVLTELKNTKSPEVLAAVEALKTDVTSTNAAVTETHEQVKTLVNALPKLESEAILAEIKTVKTALESIQMPKVDNSNIIAEVKSVHTLVSETKDAQILAEVKEIKHLVEKSTTI